MRAFSEWSMFTQARYTPHPPTRTMKRMAHLCAACLLCPQWGWDKEKSFYKRVHQQMNVLKKCNESLFHRPDLLNALPDEELFAYVKKCFRGMAME